MNPGNDFHGGRLGHAVRLPAVVVNDCLKVYPNPGGRAFPPGKPDALPIAARGRASFSPVRLDIPAF